MKKLYFSVLTFLTGLTLNAQVLTQSTHAPVVGDLYEEYQVDSTNVNPGASGTSAVWTFTSAEYTRTNVLISNTYTTPASVSSGSLYPSATVVQVNSILKNFYSSNSNQLNFWGGSFTALSQTVDYYFSSPAIHAKYAMAYGTSTTSAFTGSLQSGTNQGSISGGTSTVTVDGSGSLNLPTRSFANNIIRVNTYTGFNYTLPAFGATGTVKQQTWDYYASLANYPSTKYFPLFQIVTNTITVSLSFPTPTTIVNSNTVALLNKDYQFVGITENSKEVTELNLFPNPANGNFNLIFVNENASVVNVEISNAIGQVVKQENAPSEKGVVNHSFNIADLKSGIYFVKINVGDKSSIRKLTIQ